MQVSFDTFADLVGVFSCTGEGLEPNHSNNSSHSSPSSSPRLPVLEGIHKTSAFVAAGSATEAIRLKQAAKN